MTDISMDSIGRYLPKNRDQVVMIVVIVISLVVARGLYQQEMAKFENVKKQISEGKEKEIILERIVALNEKIKKMKYRSWDVVDFDSIVKEVFNISHLSDVKIVDSIPIEKNDEKNYTLIPFSLNGEATYKNLVRFIKKIETNKMFMRVKDIRLNPKDILSSADKDVTLGFSMTIEVFYLK